MWDFVKLGMINQQIPKPSLPNIREWLLVWSKIKIAIYLKLGVLVSSLGLGLVA